MRRCLVLALIALPVAAQPVAVTPPSLLIVPNEGRVPLGQIEGLEGGSFVARARDVGAVVFNPAGLASSDVSSISAASAAVEWSLFGGAAGDVEETRSLLSDNGALLGFVLAAPIVKDPRLRVGFALPRPVSWRPTLDLAGGRLEGQSGAGAAYSVEGKYSDVLPTLAAGYALSPRLRVGGSLGFSFLTLTQLEALSVGSGTAGGSALSQDSFRADGATYSVLLTGGLQWDISPALALGLVVGAPGIRLAGTSNVVSEETTATNTGYVNVSFHDQGAWFEVKHPLRVHVGLAWRFAKGEVEADVKVSGSTSPYDVLSSNSAGFSVEATPSGTVTRAVPFTAARDERRTVANVAVGGRYALTPKTSVHAGFFTCLSPIADPATSLFQKMDIYGVATGLSLHWAHLSGSVGLVYEWGSLARSIERAPLLSGGFSIRSIHLLWGITYSF